MKLLTLLILSLLSGSVYAAAGKAIFVYGDAWVKSVNGVTTRLEKNSEVDPGDLIITGKRGIVQLRMIDKGFISIRQSSEFQIQEFKLGATKEEDTGFFALLKGGFRAVTGVIGKRLRSAYRVTTITATIGIRGTDYTARLCNQDCNGDFGGTANRSTSVADGLYVGVMDGGVLLTNDLGTLDLDELQYGYVKDSSSAPVALLSAPEFLYFKSRPPTGDSDESDSGSASQSSGRTLAQRQTVAPESGDLASDSGIQQDLNTDQTALTQAEIQQTSSVDQTLVTSDGTEVLVNDGTLGANQPVAIATGIEGSSDSVASVNENLFAEIETSNGAVTRLNNSYLNNTEGQFDIGSASNLDLGFDPTTGISWGRWHSGTANFENAGNGANSSINLDNTSLHWVTGPTTADIALPSSGTINYQLIGNTNPTDNLGNTGVLGAASLSADFNSMTSSSSVDIGINNQVWSGAGSGAIDSNGQFSNTLNVTGNDAVSGAFTGQGNSAGFFTNNAEGAGMGFSLEATIDGTPTSVSGAAVFEQQ